MSVGLIVLTGAVMALGLALGAGAAVPLAIGIAGIIALSGALMLFGLALKVMEPELAVLSGFIETIGGSN